ncbi:hypothetical protein HC928_08325 [bacterium]|nr:hypothetical protein [bacterium]
MGVFNNQSAIGEVRDQLSLDFADGEYLNRLSANLGLTRPPFGFSDATWRALVRVIALKHKQVLPKFKEILSIILGPQVTQCAALSQDCFVGDKTLFLVDSSSLPQVGTMVIDEGLVTEETVEYIFIDRYTHRVFLRTPLVQNHTAVGVQWETGIISPAPATSSQVSVFDPSGLPSGSYTVCVGRGTSFEQAGPITAVDLPSRLVTLFPMVQGAPGVSFESAVLNRLTALATQQNVYYLSLQDVSKFASTGQIQTLINQTYTATAGTTTSVTIAGPVTASAYGGFWVRFAGNVTAALTNVLAYVTANTTTTFTFANTLGAAPATGDQFVLLANLKYLSANAQDNTLLLQQELPDLLTLAASAEIVFAKPEATLAIAQVQVKGVDWDVFQTDPYNVEILLPKDSIKNNLRTASYIRDSSLSGTSTANANRAIAAETISVGSTLGMPLIGVLEHAASTNRYSYYNPHAWLAADAAAGATSLTVTDTSQFLPSGTADVGGVTTPYTVTGATTFAVPPLVSAVRKGAQARDLNIFRLAKPLIAAVTSGDTVGFYGSYDSGDIWNVEDTWAGPYVWDLLAETHAKQTVPNNSANTALAGPTRLTVDRPITSTVLEVDDASCFPTAVPLTLCLVKTVEMLKP